MSERVRVLRDPATIRQRCAALTAWVADGGSPHFTLHRAALDGVAERVAALTRARFPDGRVPFHSRWRHFEAGGRDRRAELDARTAGRDTAALARARLDVALVSVLLDAGAGPAWTFHEASSGQRFGRSEGLALASWRAFCDGLFSSNPAEPCRVDAAALARLDSGTLGAAFQAGPHNPLLGLDGRVALLHRLAQALQADPATFGADGRPGRLFDRLTRPAGAAAAPPAVSAAQVLAALLDAFSAIWPSGQVVDGVPVGDVWPHPQVGHVPFHKLSQWLAYSWLEPLQWAGVPVSGLEALTGLPEYRNGGLLLDAGVIVARDAALLRRRWAVGDPFVVEWRALTVSLLDELAPRVRERLGLDERTMPMAAVLEGGTWAAGRQIARERRADGGPPLDIASDGTVF